jgi:hypothetical protein
MSTQKLFCPDSGGQGEGGEVFKDPPIFQSVVDDLHQLSCQGDFGFSSSSTLFDSFFSSQAITILPSKLILALR